MAVLINKGICIWVLSSDAAKWVDLYTCLLEILRVCIKAFTGFSHKYSPDGLNNTFLSQGCILEMASSLGTMGRTYISKTRVREEDPPNAQAQFEGQEAVMYSRWPPSTEAERGRNKHMEVKFSHPLGTPNEPACLKNEKTGNLKERIPLKFLHHKLTTVQIYKRKLVWCSLILLC